MRRKNNLSTLKLFCRRALFVFLVLSVLIFIPHIVLAEKTITLVYIESAQVTINQNTTIFVQGTGTCNFSLDFGDGSTVTVNNNFNKGNYQTSHSWDSSGTKTVEAKGLGPCTGIAQDTVIVASGTTPSSGKKLMKVPEQKIDVKPKYELKKSTTPKVIVKPKIEAVLPIPLGALNPGSKLYLKGSFGIQPGKIMMCGNFPGTCVELEETKWESYSKVNGVVPYSMEGRPNQIVEIKILAAAPPENNYSNIWKMSFIGKPYCGKVYEDQHLIYNTDGTVGRDCSPYSCIEDQVGVYCREICHSTGDCKKGWVCGSDGRCHVAQK